MAQQVELPSNVANLLSRIGHTAAADPVRLPTTAGEFATAAQPVPVTAPTVTPQNVLDQFNAIRSRTEYVQQPDQLSPTEKQGEKKMSHTLSYPDGTTAVTIYSTGAPRTQAEFNAALDTYDAQGKVKGFTVLRPGIQQKVRDTFESAIGAPMRAAATGIQASPDMPGTSPYIPDVVQKPVAAIANALKGVAASVPAGMSTPEGFGTVAGTVVASALLPGLGPLSTVAKMATGAGAGQLIGDVLSGTNAGNFEKRLEDAAKTATIAAFTEGATGVVKSVLNMGLSQRAHQQVADDIFKVFKEKYGPLMNDPKAFDALMSSPQRIRDIAQIGIKAIRGDIDAWRDGFVQVWKTPITPLPPTSARNVTANIVNQFQGPQQITVPGKVQGPASSQQFVTDVSAVTPWTLSPAAATEVRKYVRQMADQGNKLLDNIDSADMQSTMRQLLRETGDKIITTVKGDFAKATPAQRAALEPQVQSVIDAHISQMYEFAGAAHVLSALRESGAAHGFDVAKFQRIVQGTFKNQPGSVMEKVGNAAFRGSSGVVTDTPYTVGLPYGRLLDKIPLLNKVPGLSAATIPLGSGTRYVGKVRGTYPVTTAATQAATISSIRDYLNEK